MRCVMLVDVCATKVGGTKGLVAQEAAMGGIFLSLVNTKFWPRRIRTFRITSAETLIQIAIRRNQRIFCHCCSWIPLTLVIEGGNIAHYQPVANKGFPWRPIYHIRRPQCQAIQSHHQLRRVIRARSKESVALSVTTNGWPITPTTFQFRSKINRSSCAASCRPSS